jgi:hypothetical protein
MPMAKRSQYLSAVSVMVFQSAVKREGKIETLNDTNLHERQILFVCFSVI